VKTAEEWIKEIDEAAFNPKMLTQEGRIEFTKRIQLDAYKAGLTKAIDYIEENEMGIVHIVQLTVLRNNLKELP